MRSFMKTVYKAAKEELNQQQQQPPSAGSPPGAGQYQYQPPPNNQYQNPPQYQYQSQPQYQNPTPQNQYQPSYGYQPYQQQFVSPPPSSVGSPLPQYATPQYGSKIQSPQTWPQLAPSPAPTPAQNWAPPLPARSPVPPVNNSYFPPPAAVASAPTTVIDRAPISPPLSPPLPSQAQALVPANYTQPLAPISSHSLVPYTPQSPSNASVQVYTPPPSSTQSIPPSTRTPSLTPPSTTASRVPAVPHVTEPQAAMQVPGLQGKAPSIKKVLSLDGGGIRGLSIILILQEIMEQLRDQRGVPDLQPWQEFDMICGTSTGGLIALMLGRLRMSLDECEEAYLHMSKEIFTPVSSSYNVVGKGLRYLNGDARFDGAPLENNIHKILGDKGLPKNEPLFEQETSDSCKVFVCAVSQENASTVTMRTYKTKEHDRISRVAAIWEAARATSAASTFFPPISIGRLGQSFADGGLRHNNPVNLAEYESSVLWPNSDRMIISVGTGCGPGPSLAGNLKDLALAVTKIATDTEEHNELFQKQHPVMVASSRFYRFNVAYGLSNIGLAEHEAVGAIGSHTDVYLKNPETASKMLRCVETLSGSQQRMAWVGGEELSEHLQKLAFSDIFCDVCSHCWRGLPYNQDCFYCPDCKITVCTMCCTVHDSAHSTKLARLTNIHVQQRMDGIEPTSECSHCAQVRACRMQCKSCKDHSLCLGCFCEEDRQETFFKKHEETNPSHRAYTFVFPEYWRQTPPTRPCACTDVQGLVAHCTECNEVCTVGSTLYLCRQCYHDTGAQAYLCETCYARDDAHRKVHSFLRVIARYDNSMPDEFDEARKMIFSCPECPPGQYINVNAIASHRHATIYMNVNAVILEFTVIYSARMCRYKRLDFLETKAREAKQCTNDKSAVNCNYCTNPIPWDLDIGMCVTNGCLWAYCVPCMAQGRHRHRHNTVQTCGFKKPETGLWKNGTLNLHNHCCDLCGDKGGASMFIGIMCSKCLNYDVCVKCLIKLEKGQLPGHGDFSHKTAPILGKQCPGKSWIFWRMA